MAYLQWSQCTQEHESFSVGFEWSPSSSSTVKESRVKVTLTMQNTFYGYRDPGQNQSFCFTWSEFRLCLAEGFQIAVQTFKIQNQP